VRRHFEQLSRFPEGLLPIGDSICHYNPLYGQGMSAACRQAMALQRTLHRAAAGGDGLEGLWRSFLPEAYQEIRAPWLFATLADFSNPKCTGDFPSEESGTLAVLQYVMGLARDGDAEAQGVARAIGGLTTRLDVLEAPPWPERFAASQGK
jgi:flavin-dependent dehydrogenase